MVPAFFFLLFLSVPSVLLCAPVDVDDASAETPMLLDDIVIPDIQSRNADPCTAWGCKWPKSERFVYVPYNISTAYSEEERNRIIDALKSFNESTCIRFVPRKSSHRDYIHFFSGEGCWSYLGRQKGGQKISLKRKGCFRFGTIQHEILHALGFNHEQSRSDRDEYVWILFKNIEEELHGLTTSTSRWIRIVFNTAFVLKTTGKETASIYNHIYFISFLFLLWHLGIINKYRKKHVWLLKGKKQQNYGLRNSALQ
ncbi:high choriolytic enzyme 2 isoform X1 [Fundulus heteroclitus]|uniref:high choriolytic enzyme 2 isoform X1 n=1 Tax=Fundulus heteroclitus TaxID=8078 RepID=UPI00165B2226|nr:high choriolytic enzyme 2 isoform X1 [Fundulus heteroclitus]